MPMVTMLKVSLSITARPKSNTSPAQIKNTTSTLGVRSLSPVSSANRVGMVAQCITMGANHPRVSADSFPKCCWKKFVIADRMLLKISFMMAPYKIYAALSV